MSKAFPRALTNSATQGFMASTALGNAVVYVMTAAQASSTGPSPVGSLMVRIYEGTVDLPVSTLRQRARRQRIPIAAVSQLPVVSSYLPSFVSH